MWCPGLIDVEWQSFFVYGLEKNRHRVGGGETGAKFLSLLTSKVLNISGCREGRKQGGFSVWRVASWRLEMNKMKFNKGK